MRVNDARRLVLAALAVACACAPACAQAPAPAAPVAPPAATPPAAPVAAAAAPEHLEVKRFILEGLSLIDEREVQRTLAPWLGRQGIDGLHEAAAAVQRLFARAGYGSVAVYLPPQVIGPDGAVTLRIVVGKLTRINVHRASATFDEDNLRASLPALMLGQTPRLLELDAQLRLVHQNPAKRIDLLLIPGDQASTTHAQVVLQPAEPVIGAHATIDNTGDERSGRWRFGLEARHANLTGRDDVLAARFLTSDRPERVKVAMLAWRLPRYAQRLMIDTYVAYADIDGGSTATPAGDLRFEGSGRLAGVRATHYLLRTGEAEHSAFAALDYRDHRNQCSLDGLPGGACGAAGADVTLRPLRLGYEWSRDGVTQWGFGAEWRRNLASSGSQAAAFEQARPGARADYSLLQANARAGGAIGEESRWQLRVTLQWTDRPLPSAEQFGIGGAATVRGFDERGLVGDRGAAATLEWTGPELAPSAAASPRGGAPRPAAWSLRPAVFVDGGWVANRGGLECRAGRVQCDLASYGLGLRWAGTRGGMKLDAALPLKTDIAGPSDGVRLHVAGQWRFF